MPHSNQVPEPWHSFLCELDREATEETRLDCLDEFVVTQLYGLARTTSDLDVLLIAPREQRAPLLELGVRGGALHIEARTQHPAGPRRHKILGSLYPLDLKILKERCEKELCFQLGIPQREDLLSLKLWAEMIEGREQEPRPAANHQRFSCVYFPLRLSEARHRIPPTVSVTPCRGASPCTCTCIT